MCGRKVSLLKVTFINNLPFTIYTEGLYKEHFISLVFSWKMDHHGLLPNRLGTIAYHLSSFQSKVIRVSKAEKGQMYIRKRNIKCSKWCNWDIKIPHTGDTKSLAMCR